MPSRRKWTQLAFSPLTIRETLVELIEKEIGFAIAGKPAQHLVEDEQPCR